MSTTESTPEFIEHATQTLARAQKVGDGLIAYLEANRFHDIEEANDREKAQAAIEEFINDVRAAVDCVIHDLPIEWEQYRAQAGAAVAR